MRYAFVASILCVCGNVLGEDAATIPSVVNHGAAEPAAISVAEPVAANVSDCVDCPVEAVTVNSRVRGRLRFRTVTESCDVCTGRPVRSVTRGVVRGADAVVTGASAAVVSVITLPARVCRNGRCSRN